MSSVEQTTWSFAFEVFVRCNRLLNADAYIRRLFIIFESIKFLTVYMNMGAGKKTTKTTKTKKNTWEWTFTMHVNKFPLCGSRFENIWILNFGIRFHSLFAVVIVFGLMLKDSQLPFVSFWATPHQTTLCIENIFVSNYCHRFCNFSGIDR